MCNFTHFLSTKINNYDFFLANYDIDKLEADIELAFEICRFLENEMLREKAGFWKIQNEKLEIENKISTMTKNWSIRFEEVQNTLKKIGKDIALKRYDQFTLMLSQIPDRNVTTPETRYSKP